MTFPKHYNMENVREKRNDTKRTIERKAKGGGEIGMEKNERVEVEIKKRKNCYNNHAELKVCNEVLLI